jgi:hypothetical protein
MNVFPNLPCPLFIILVTGYLFQRLNITATILPEDSALNQNVAHVNVNGTYIGVQEGSFFKLVNIQ